MRPLVFASLLVLLAPGLEAQEPRFVAGELVRVVRHGETVEAWVVGQDAAGVLVSYHDGSREHKPAHQVQRVPGGRAEGGVLKVRRPQSAAPAPPPAPRDPPPAPAQAGGALPDGEYGCYTYHPNAILVGVLTISGSAYRTRTGAAGRYRLAGDRVSWLGTAPMGFAVAVLEETAPAKLRMYAQASDVGNKWKAAVCTQRAPR